MPTKLLENTGVLVEQRPPIGAAAVPFNGPPRPPFGRIGAGRDRGDRGERGALRQSLARR
jgi:hypothetical protein